VLLHAVRDGPDVVLVHRPAGEGEPREIPREARGDRPAFAVRDGVGYYLRYAWSGDPPRNTLELRALDLASATGRSVLLRVIPGDHPAPPALRFEPPVPYRLGDEGILLWIDGEWVTLPWLAKWPEDDGESPATGDR
jgi:hypothetical protein